jgi:hypothetical protein
MSQQHPLFRLGKKEAKLDKRNLLLASIAKAVKLPEEYSFDALHPEIPLKMYANNIHGDCVLVGRANLTTRFKINESKTLLNITDKEVLDEYFRESGGRDEGLILLDSIKSWRTDGWTAGGKHWKILGFAQASPRVPDQIKQVIYAQVGCKIGLRLPLSAQYEINAGKPWAQTSGAGSQKGSWGGHCVVLCGYTKFGPIALTWGMRQLMSWKFLATYCDEAYAIIDAVNSAQSRKVLSAKALNSFLETL